MKWTNFRHVLSAITHSWMLTACSLQNKSTIAICDLHLRTYYGWIRRIGVKRCSEWSNARERSRQWATWLWVKTFDQLPCVLQNYCVKVRRSTTVGDLIYALQHRVQWPKRQRNQTKPFSENFYTMYAWNIQKSVTGRRPTELKATSGLFYISDQQ
jgi:hypothetical protein